MREMVKGQIQTPESVDLAEYINAEELSNLIGVKPTRFRAWYNWYYDPMYSKPEGFPELPHYIKIGNFRYWKKSDIEGMIIFKQALNVGNRGAMGEYNARNWQQRGKSALEKKGRMDLVEKYFKNK